jgi:hemophore-related protein
MVTLSLTRLAAVIGGLALSLAAGAGVASADPLIDTTCNYSQVVSALNAQDPAAAAEFDASPAAQSWLRSFLASSPAGRQQMLAEVQSMPGAAQYAGTVEQVANTCNDY